MKEWDTVFVIPEKKKNTDMEVMEEAFFSEFLIAFFFPEKILVKRLTFFGN